MESAKFKKDKLRCRQISDLLSSLTKKLGTLCSKIPCLICRRPRPRIMIKRLGKMGSKCKSKGELCISKSATHTNGLFYGSPSAKSVRVATFNAALFAAAPVVPKIEMSAGSGHQGEVFQQNSADGYPRSILKPLPSHPSLDTVEQRKFMKSKMRVSINLPENEISLARSRLVSSMEHDEDASSSGSHRSSVPVRSPLCFPASASKDKCSSGSRTILEVLREVDADIWALQDVKADEEKNMQPLSDLAGALGMKYVFAHSWAPEYGNAILSKWPIKRWRVQKILNDEDIRNVLKATIEVPWIGEVSVYCTQLDYLDENWRMEQMKAIIQSSEGPHILAGGLNSLDRSDYSLERWTDIVKYFEEIGKPKPRDEVMEFLEGRGYEDAKYYAGECEPVVIIAKGQNVQGTCKYGTRVDYILSSSDSPYKFLPGSYSVISSKGTSDHHIVKVDIKRGGEDMSENVRKHQRKAKQRIIRIVDPCSSKGIWQIDR
ncbi:hypothetical protein Ancab_030480 [Ancistrocladus abbreviatus]